MQSHRFIVRFAILWISVGPVSLARVAGAEDAATPAGGSQGMVSYWNEVRPIFQAHCQGCHQPAKAGGEYIMTDFAKLLAGGESGAAAIHAGDPDGSQLLAMITPQEGVAEMPRGQAPLEASQIELIRNWIAAGAVDDTPASARQQFDQDHPPTYAAAPVVTALAFSPDGKWLAVSGYHEVLLHELAPLLASPPGAAGHPARLVGMSERIESLAFSPDGSQLAVVGGSPGRLGELQLWDLASRSLVRSIPVTFDTCYGASWSPDGRLVAIGCPDNTVRAYDVASGRQVLFNGAHNDWVLDTVFAVDGQHLVTVSRDQSMKLIEVATERFVDNITSITPGALKGGLHAVDRHPTENHLLIGGADGVPKTYRMFREQDRKIGDDFNLIKQYPAVPGRIFAAEYRRDGKQILVGSSLDGTGEVNLFDTESGELAVKLAEIPTAIYAATFSPDGQWVASGGFAGDVYLHHASTGARHGVFLPIPLTDPTVNTSPQTVRPTP